MTRTHYLENSSHQQCAMQFKLSNSICLERENNLLGFNFAVFFLRSCLTSFYRQVLPKVTTYSDRANVVQIQCPQLFDDYKVKAQ